MPEYIVYMPNRSRPEKPPSTNKFGQRRIIPDSALRIQKLKTFDAEQAYAKYCGQARSPKRVAALPIEKFTQICILLLATDYSDNMISRMLSINKILPVSKIRAALGLRSDADVQAIKKLHQDRGWNKNSQKNPGLEKPKPIMPSLPTLEQQPSEYLKHALALLRADTTLTPPIKGKIIDRIEQVLKAR